MQTCDCNCDYCNMTDEIARILEKYDIIDSDDLAWELEAAIKAWLDK